MRKWALVTTMILTVAAATGVRADESKPLRVGLSTDYKPLAFTEDGQVRGLEADFAHRLARDLRRPLELTALAWDDLIPALRGGRIDVIMSGMSVTRERGELVSFARPYLQVGQMLLVRAPEVDRFRDPAALNQPAMRIGAQRNTTGEFYARRELAKAQVRAYDSIDAGIGALRAKEIDAFVHDAPTIWRVRGREASSYQDLRGRYRPLTEEYLAWAVRKDDTALRAQLDAALDEWRDSGWLEEALDLWIPVRKLEIPVP